MEKNKQIILDAIYQTVNHSSRGIFKIIDQNRQLMGLLQKDAPELLERCPWIRAWIKDCDFFLVTLADATEAENSFKDADYVFPRPWPEC